MEESYYDSMYEMNAPGCVDFDATDITVDESIFDRQIVGEKIARPFNDISNVTPQWSDGSLLAKKSRTPVTHSPMLAEVTRRVTRSATKELNTISTPKQPLPSISVKCQPEPAGKPSQPTSQTKSLGKNEPSNKPLVKPEILSKPITYTSAQNGSPAPVKKTLVKKESPAMSADSLVQKRDSLDRQVRPRTSSVGKKPHQPAHSGTPFKGKKSPMKTLRARTRSKEIEVVKPMLRSRTSSANTNSTQTANSLTKRRSNSQSELTRARTTSTGISPTLSRLMRPTEATISRRPPVSNGSSPAKRKILTGSASKPPKIQKNTIPKSPTFLHRFRTRSRTLKSTEDLEMERIAKEKIELNSLKKKNDQGLRSISSSGSKPHSMTTRSDETGKAKRSIYDEINQQTSTYKPANYSQIFAPSTATAASSQRQVYPSTHKVTKPLSPKLHTKLRERPPAVLSASEREQMELELIKQSQFKATPVDKNMYDAKLKKVPQQPLTQPMPIKFATDERLAKHAEKQTEPSPAEPILKAKPAPKPKTVFKPTLEHKRTEAAPFTFESKDEAAKRRKEELIRRVEEEERKLREFKAKPLPPSPSPLPEKPVLPVTVPEPFQLKIDERGEVQQMKLKRKVEAETSRMLAATRVRAKPADVLKKAPFVPKKEVPKVTEPFNVELSSAKRAVERQEYEQRKMEMEAEVRVQEEEMMRRKEARERRELIKLRQETIIKPAPIKQYKPLQIVQSDKPLTQPKSPRFAKK